MNNKFYIIGILFLSLGFFACDDELNDLEPFTEAEPSAFLTTPQNFEIVMNGVYRQLWLYYSDPGSGLQGIPDIISDNVILAQTGRRSNADYYDLRYVASTLRAIPLYWSEAYEAINGANLIIENISNIDGTTEQDNILGQALAARAWAHFDLARIYGQIPTQSAGANGTLGAVYLKAEDGDTGSTIEDALAEPARETIASNYEEIIEDLERASTLISEDSNGEGTLNKNGVEALLSRVYLYNGEYQKVIDAANKVTASLATAEELPDVYIDNTNAGVVIELSINTSSQSRGNNVGVLYSQSSRGETVSEYVMDFDFFNSIDATDVRKSVLQFVGINDDIEYNAIKKFLGEEGQTNGLVDVKVLRMAEVILNKAEAQFELGLEADALASLNELREVRYSPYVAGTETGVALEDAIQFERRVELAYEGHRFFDLKRRGEGINRNATNGDIIDGTGTPPTEATLPAGNFRFQFPIPIGEINANSTIAKQQNPGY
ncbi:RagB/SusD family nutrient uptake outer membrane protein [Aquimarina aquimarini]|uniref:RagB/SusD family nutrient uptake outer membrane protein n=1 Tax=Aquimarina aquimarini TaxID=1191734 RepID=UPI000D54E235|nr:RagB/SusD family nutrient uptake outer membrane protein [Aquimarina aquimarini]